MHRINRRMLLGGAAGLAFAGAAQARRPAVSLARSDDGNPLTTFYESLMVRAECEWIGNEVIVLQQWLPEEGIKKR